eukprot:TRINITY_DN8379_c0_g1_i15.p1 TRINITY_DN8379_c0_g1~~TRINITY_DN8379_c0_g1_i15.p1  ORF type:complete len:111 (+),score=17.33 TRINITY_DN8379_c0_g1_i15:152-484(+)
MSDEDDLQQPEPTPKQKKEIAKWFLANAPPGEIHYIAKDIQSIIADEDTYHSAVSEAYPLYNKAHMISLELPNRTGDVLITTFGEIDETEYLDPRTCQVATVNHVKQSTI